MSDGALRLAAGLPFPYRFGLAAWIIPRSIRDWAYRILARNRRKFSGQTWCALPPAGVDLSDRLLG
jgi:predicted DCC family thiol-disulfide oxidoreductase YuxK